MNYFVIALSVLVIAFFVYSYLKIRQMKNMAPVADKNKILALTDKSFDHRIKSGVTMVDFWAPWCMPCKMMAPILNDVADGTEGNRRVAKLNVDESPAVAAKYNVRSIPTLIVFKDGKEMERFVGIKQKDFLIKQLAKY